ncbi:MAG: nitronate monooxygenase [Limisphaerales bacterium]
MLTTDFTRLVGCQVPVQLAGMGGMVTPQLACAVSNAGGLGMLAAAAVPKALLDETIGQVLSQLSGGSVNRKVGINFLMPFVDDARVELAAEKLDLVEFFYGDPDSKLIERVHSYGKLAGWQIGSAPEAQAAVAAGCDYIVAQGVEAGGHVRGTLPLFVLLDQLESKIDVPVLAAGGVSTGVGLAAVLAAGASGIRVGTRFLVAHESAAHPEYVDALLMANADDTVLTEAYSIGWPNAPHRVLRASVEAAEAERAEVVGTIEVGAHVLEIPRFNVVPPDASAKGNVTAMCQYAGQSVEIITQRASAAAIVEDIIAGAARQIERICAMTDG